MCLCSVHELIDKSKYYMSHAYTTDIISGPEGTDPLEAADQPLYYSFARFVSSQVL